ncbi:hypothetical protein MLD38_002248 [Melastoma candidum]|uniref:Uncharacterized protein n=1 Tax=Melastoma candidum TaxID=119954 RepID=A0ACB9SFW9_9MYRT|nr:hypothetical protein MLD38_002248 [Melastoma candidum]
MGAGSAMWRQSFKANDEQVQQPHPGNAEAGSLAFSTSVFPPFSYLKVFKFLRGATRGHKWDPLSKELDKEEIVAMHTAGGGRNKVSIVRSKNASNPISMGDILHGNNPDDVLILPSGFAILS